MLKGDLADFTLPDILRLLSLTSKSGRLQLQRSGARGRVDLTAGRVMDASADAERLSLARRLIGRGMIDGDTLRALLSDGTPLPTDLELARQLVAQDRADPGDLAEVLREQAVDAVFDLLRWPSGSFQFETVATEPSAAPMLSLVIEDLLMEVEQRSEGWETIRERTGPGDHVVAVVRPERTAVELDADGWQLLGIIDGQRTVDDLAVLTGRGQFDTREALVGLLDLGVIAIGDQGSAGSIDRLLADHRVLVELEGHAAGLGADDVPVAPSMDAVAVTSPPAAATTETAAQQQPVSAPVVIDPAVLGPVITHPVAVIEPGTAQVTPLRPAGREGRLRTDPSVDAELVSRLIDGVEGM